MRRFLFSAPIRGALILQLLFASATLWSSTDAAYAGARDEDAKRAMQEKLNTDTINRGFDPGDYKQLEADLDEAVKKGVKPPMSPGPHWRPGYTCGSVSPYYWEYRNCLLYYRYYRCYYCL
jgi:hypothetical protein